MVVAYSLFAAVLIFRGSGSPFSGIRDSVDAEAPGAAESYVVVTETLEDGTEVQIRDYRPSGANTPRIDELNSRVRPFVLYGVLGLLCVAYYTVIMVNAISHRFVERIDPFSARIEDPSEFSEARKLALRGDIDGAVRVYRSYPEKAAEAHFEAARLLKSHDRFAEAAQLLEEVVSRFYGSRVIWADASYQLAKIYDNHLDRPGDGADLLRQILARAPETRFGQLANNEMARLRALDGVSSPRKVPPAQDTSAVPHRALRGVHRQYEDPVQLRAEEHGEPDDTDAPPVDPFFVRRLGLTNPATPPVPPASDDEASDEDAQS
jgi:hypothetical protein